MTTPLPRSVRCFGGPLNGKLVTIEPGADLYSFAILEDIKEIPWGASGEPAEPVAQEVVTYSLRHPQT